MGPPSTWHYYPDISFSLIFTPSPNLRSVFVSDPYFLYSYILVVFYFGRLPFCLSSILIVIHFICLLFLSSTFWSSSILFVFNFGRLPFKSSSILAAFHLIDKKKRSLNTRKK